MEQILRALERLERQLPKPVYIKLSLPPEPGGAKRREARVWLKHVPRVGDSVLIRGAEVWDLDADTCKIEKRVTGYVLSVNWVINDRDDLHFVEILLREHP